MIRLYGVARSRATRVIWLLNEIGMTYEHVPCIQASRLKDPDLPQAPLNTASRDFLRISPMGMIPVIEDGDLVLSESLAINLYLAKKYGGALGPQNEIEEALTMQWGLFGVTAIEPSAIEIYYIHARAQQNTGTGKAGIIAAADTLRRPMRVLNEHLVANGWLVGRRFTVADINMAEIVRYAATEAAVMKEFPAVTSWLETLHARDGFKTMWTQRLAEPA